MLIIVAGILVLTIALIAAWCFGRWLKSQADFTNQDKIGSWDIFIKLIGGVGIIKTFWELYWGKMVRHAGPEVEAAMVRFGGALKDWELTKTKPDELPQLSLSLAKAIQEDLISTRP